MRKSFLSTSPRECPIEFSTHRLHKACSAAVLNDAQPYSEMSVSCNNYDVISQLPPVSTKQHQLALGRIKPPIGSSHVSTHRCICLSTSADYNDDAAEGRVTTLNSKHSLCKPMQRHGKRHGETQATEQMRVSFLHSSQSNEGRPS